MPLLGQLRQLSDVARDLDMVSRKMDISEAEIKRILFVIAKIS